MRQKSELREFALSYRNSLEEERYLELSHQITYKLCYISPFKEAFTYHFFVGAMHKREIFTKPIIHILLNSGRNVFVPKIIDDKRLSTHKINSIQDLQPGLFGIEEPVTIESKEKNFDCIILPMLAADLKGNRVGYGKGYYDRFLEQTTGVKIGIVYDACVVEEVETDEYDIPLDMIITEKRVIDIKTQKQFIN